MIDTLQFSCGGDTGKTERIGHGHEVGAHAHVLQSGDHLADSNIVHSQLQHGIGAVGEVILKGRGQVGAVHVGVGQDHAHGSGVIGIPGHIQRHISMAGSGQGDVLTRADRSSNVDSKVSCDNFSQLFGQSLDLVLVLVLAGDLQADGNGLPLGRIATQIDIKVITRHHLEQLHLPGIGGHAVGSEGSIVGDGICNCAEVG